MGKGKWSGMTGGEENTVNHRIYRDMIRVGV